MKGENRCYRRECWCRKSPGLHGRDAIRSGECRYTPEYPPPRFDAEPVPPWIRAQMEVAKL